VAVAVVLLPVSAFLLLLILLDSFKLVPTVMLVRAVVAGAVAALVAHPIHAALIDATGLPDTTFARYAAPVTEETLKALCLLYPLWKRQVGFLVDAAIIGFAIGTGFAVVENIEYLRNLTETSGWVWIARGFGTAVLHGTTTAVIAIVAKSLGDRYPRRGGLVVLPGLAAAIVLHSAFNHTVVSPLLAASMLVFVLPLVVMMVFGQSERRTREWVGDGLDLDVELLDLVRSAHFGTTRLGRYLEELKTRFPGPIVADMFCLLQLDLELAIRVKGMLMARDAGLQVPVDSAVKDRLAERAYLRKTIGKTGLIALRPLQMTNAKDDWHEYLLKHT
jgi:RsiW-degrading membrane proteinase PrsW (M82 family)